MFINSVTLVVQPGHSIFLTTLPYRIHFSVLFHLVSKPFLIFIRKQYWFYYFSLASLFLMLFDSCENDDFCFDEGSTSSNYVFLGYVDDCKVATLEHHG